jgi:preprotein translocase subunit SecE
MATSGTREGPAAIAEEQNRPPLVSKPLGWIADIRQFWREIVQEMKKVSWPTRTEVVNTTIITVVVVIFFAAFLWVADIALSYLVQGIEWAARKVFG